MADTGLPWSLPFPLLTDQPNGPLSIQNLATQVAAMLGFAYPCLSTGHPTNIAGRIIFETDTNKYFIGDGAAWNPVAFGDDLAWTDAIGAGTTASTNFTLTSGSLRRKNGVCSINLSLTSTLGWSAGDVTNTPICVLPGGFVPSTTAGPVSGGALGPSWQGYVNGGDGTVYLASTTTALSAGGGFSALATYVL
jgi:hypothetical protein